jgi:DNA polymerase (family 10)
MGNEELVLIFKNTARLKEILGENTFKVLNYARASEAVDTLPRPISTYSRAELEKLLGKAMGSRAAEYADTGQVAEYNKLLEDVPATLLDLFRISSLGTKKIANLWREHGVATMAQLEVACTTGAISSFAGFGEGMRKKILEGMAELKGFEGKLRLDKGLVLAGALLHQIKTKMNLDGQIVGSLARRLEIVEHIELLCSYPAGLKPRTTRHIRFAS